MSLFTRRAAPPVETFFGSRWPGTVSGQSVTPDSAMRRAAVFRSARLIADPISTMPLAAYRKTEGVRLRIRRTAWLDEPQTGWSLIEWLDAICMSLLFDGNAFGILTLDDGGFPTGVNLLDPARVKIQAPHGQPVQYQFAGTTIPTRNIWHIRGLSWPGRPRGLNPIAYARETVGTALAGTEYIASFFGAGGTPNLEVIADADLTEAEAKKIKDDVTAVLNGSRDPWVHGKSLESKTWQLSPADAAFLDVMQATDVDCARFMGVSPTMIDAAVHGSSVTYANREQRAIDHLIYSVGPWMTRIEEGLNRLTPSPNFFKLNPDALLRTDILTRTQVHDMNVRLGKNSIDEVRAREDEEPLPDGQGAQYLWPPYRVSPLSSDEVTSGT